MVGEKQITRADHRLFRACEARFPFDFDFGDDSIDHIGKKLSIPYRYRIYALVHRIG